MLKGLKSLAEREYPGRIIIIGRDKSGENAVVVYAITGRSSSSQARKLKFKDDAIWAKSIDEETIKKGNRDLLVYPALLFSQGIVVSNGKQTRDIEACLGLSPKPEEVLECALHKWDYEPDSPTFTPRISGCVLPQKKAALCIIKRARDGSSKRKYYKIPLIKGKGKMISTYRGKNRDPLPAFAGEPIDIEIEGQRADEMAEAVYDALEPKPGRKDLRVSVACVFSNDLIRDKYEIYIINKHERIKGQDGKNRERKPASIQD